MKKNKICTSQLFAAVFVLFVTSSCTKDEVNIAPGNITLTSPSNSATNVALNAALTWQAVTDPDGDAIT